MMGYDEQLRALQAQCTRKQKLEATAEELRAQLNDYTARTRELKAVFQAEQEDVDRLKGRSLSAFLYHLTGKMDEKLSREQQEAYEARVKYDAAIRELEGIQEDLRRCQRELVSLRDCPARYADLLREKTQAIKGTGGAVAEQILRLEERQAYLEDQKQELEEAITVGNAALATADQIAEHLNSAKSWGTYDLIGGGLIADLAKHGHLDDAQASVEQLQSQLRRFKTELADVTIDANFQVSIDGFLRVTDYFLDDIFSDWTVLDHIHQSQDKVQNTRTQICRVLDHLHTLQTKTAAEQADIRQQIQNLVDGVPL